MNTRCRPIHLWSRSLVAQFLITSALCLHASVGHCLTTGIVTESVGDYHTARACGSDMPGMRSSGNAFFDKMTASGTGWTGVHRYFDGQVYDTDFTDPELTGLSRDSDTYNFDPPGAAISYFSGHGTCDDFPTPNFCNGQSECTTPGWPLPATCDHSPATGQKGCVYSVGRKLVTCSSSDQYGGFINYSTSNIVSWGESPNAGTWRGAGTNGGTNLVVMDLSCPVRPNLWNTELLPVFGGLQLLLTEIIVWGDTADNSGRGPGLATLALANPSGNVSAAWGQTLLNLPQNSGTSCAGASSHDYTYGGGRGINGCGGAFSYSVDSTSFWTGWHVTSERWSDFQYDSNDSNGSQYFAWEVQCNYDCNTYPWYIP